MNETYVKGGQVGEIVQNGKCVVKLHEYFCLMHFVHEPERSSPNFMARKLILIKMGQGTVEEYNKEGRKIEYFMTCPICFQTVKEGEYIKNE